jgi:hypothetical protein
MIDNDGLLKAIETVEYAGSLGGTDMFDVDNIDLSVYTDLKEQIETVLKPNIDELTSMSDELCASLGTLLAKNCNQTYSFDMNYYDSNAEDVRELIEHMVEACEYV